VGTFCPGYISDEAQKQQDALWTALGQTVDRTLHNTAEAEAEPREGLFHRHLRDGEHRHARTKAQADSKKEAKEALLQRLASVEARANKDAWSGGGATS